MHMYAAGYKPLESDVSCLQVPLRRTEEDQLYVGPARYSAAGESEGLRTRSL